MQAIIGSRTARVCLIAIGLFLLVRALLLMQNRAQDDSETWTLHILTSSILGGPSHKKSDNSSLSSVTASSATPGIVSRLKNAIGDLMDSSTQRSRIRAANESRLIIDWTTFFGNRLSELTKGSMSRCPFKCNFSNDKTLVDQADAVVFHLRDTNPDSLPKVRHSFQRYVFFLMESPQHSGSAVGRLSKNFFNWTMTYRLDSDILCDYDRLLLKNATSSYTYEKNAYSWDHVQNVTKGKTKMVAQFVSNCHTPSKRENYVQALSRHISVDVYGSCSGLSCSRDKSECAKMLTNDYLFYLAFENSICLDYVTEKFWRMKTLIVPIVLRGSDYEHIAPKGSYIAADRFKSPKELAVYLNTLANNRTEYLTFFEWTKDYWYGGKGGKNYCDLCEMLHDDSLPPKIYDNMEKWWHGRGNCQNDFAQKLLN